MFIGNNAVPSKREDMYPIGVKSIEVCFDYCKGKRDREGTTWDTVLYIESKGAIIFNGKYPPGVFS